MEPSQSNLFSKKNLISYLIMAILIVAIPVAVKLVQTQQQLKSRATEGNELTVLTDNNTHCDAQGDNCTTSVTDIKLKLTSPFGTGGTSSITPPPPPPPSGGTSFPIGVGIDSSTLDWWNSKALSTDLVLGNITTLNSVSSAKGVKVLFINPADPVTSMDTAKTNGWTMVTSNIEESDIDYVISQEIPQYQMAKDRGLTFTFGPTGRQLEDSYSYQDFALVRNADIIAYQTQRYQDDSGFSVEQYASTVKDLIGKIRPYTAKKQVKVQVSVNPPANRCTTADNVIKYIDSITSGSNTADAIVIFYSPGIYDSECSEKRVDVMKQVVDRYR